MMGWHVACQRWMGEGMKTVWPQVRVALAGGTLLALVLSSTGAGPARAAMGGATFQQTKRAGAYKLVLMIGPLEHMYTPAEVKKKHPTSGEVMVSGTMVMGGMGRAGAMPNHHLELHVYSAATGKTITHAVVSLTITTAAGKVIARVPIAQMYGVKEGTKDWHYGNNVLLKPGHYHVTAGVEMTTAAFDVMLGSTAMSGM
jgi:hypothetical protein